MCRPPTEGYRYDYRTMLMFTMLGMPYWFTSQYLLQRSFAGKTVFEASRGLLLAALFTGAERPRFVVLLPGTALLPDDTPPCPRRWLFSPVSGERLATAAFGNLPTDVATVGNVLIASSEVLGLAARDLWADELDFVDPQYPVIVALTTRSAGA